jgi:hypothetical protein
MKHPTRKPPSKPKDRSVKAVKMYAPANWKERMGIFGFFVVTQWNADNHIPIHIAPIVLPLARTKTRRGK